MNPCVNVNNTYTIILTLSQTSPGFYTSAVPSLLKTLWEKGEIARNK